MSVFQTDGAIFKSSYMAFSILLTALCCSFETKVPAEEETLNEEGEQILQKMSLLYKLRFPSTDIELRKLEMVYPRQYIKPARPQYEQNERRDGLRV